MSIELDAFLKSIHQHDAFLKSIHQQWRVEELELDGELSTKEGIVYSISYTSILSTEVLPVLVVADIALQVPPPSAPLAALEHSSARLVSQAAESEPRPALIVAVFL